MEVGTIIEERDLVGNVRRTEIVLPCGDDRGYYSATMRVPYTGLTRLAYEAGVRAGAKRAEPK